MNKYVITRLLQAIPTLFLTSVGIFVLLRVLPGDPTLAIAGPEATPETIAAIRQDLALDDPLPAQYLTWLRHVLEGDLGRSLVARRPVVDLLGQALPASLELLLAAMVVAVSVGGLLGCVAAMHRGHVVDVLIGYANAVLIGVPGFWLGLLAILLFALVLGWLPPGGRVEPAQNLSLAARSLVLPALVLGLGHAAVIARFVRAGILEVLSEPYIRTARGKGLRNRDVLAAHVLPNALIPVVTIVGVQIGQLIGGAVIVETVFAWPGMGRLAVNAIGGRDYTVVQAVVLILVAGFVVVNLATDMLYGYFDLRTSRVA
jgi:ABC-type dipeptide/oligopeptide/nickel transport system permease component